MALYNFEGKQKEASDQMAALLTVVDLGINATDSHARLGYRSSQLFYPEVVLPITQRVEDGMLQTVCTSGFTQEAKILFVTKCTWAET